MVTRFACWIGCSTWRALLVGLLIEGGLIFGLFASFGFSIPVAVDPRSLAFGVTQIPAILIGSLVPTSLKNDFSHLVFLSTSLLQAVFLGLIVGVFARVMCPLGKGNVGRKR